MVNTNGKCVHAFAAWLDLETQGDIYTTMVESAHKKGRLSVTKSWVVNDERMFSFLKQGKYMYCLWCGWKKTKEELESKIVNSSGLKVYNFIYLHVRSIHCVNYMLGKTHKEIGNQLNPSMQRGFNENETKLILCSIFSISTFNDLYLFA